MNYEPGSQNFETDERETHKRNIPTPHDDPNDQESPNPNVIHAYIPSFSNNSQNLRRVPFRAQDQFLDDARVAQRPHEFSIRLDPNSLGLDRIAQSGNPTALKREAVQIPTY